MLQGVAPPSSDGIPCENLAAAHSAAISSASTTSQVNTTSTGADSQLNLKPAPVVLEPTRVPSALNSLDPTHAGKEPDPGLHGFPLAVKLALEEDKFLSRHEKERL